MTLVRPMIFATLAFTLILMLPATGLPAYSASLRTVEPSGSAQPDDPPSSYGYAGVVINSGVNGVYFQSVDDGSPASKSGLKKNDRLEGFKIVGSHARIYKSLRKTISYNPNKTILLKINRSGTRMQIPLRVSSLQDYPNDAILEDKREERKRDREGIRYSRDLLADAPEVPQVIEFFDNNTGPSSILLSKRLEGLKVQSLSLDDLRTQLKLKRLNLARSPQIVAVDDFDEILYPFPIGNDWRVNRELFYSLDYAFPEAGEFATISFNGGPPIARELPAILSEQELALRNTRFDGWPPIVHTGMGSILFDGRGGHLGPSISPLRPYAHTWFYQNQHNFVSGNGTELGKALRALVRQTVQSLNDNSLDTKQAASRLIGEAIICGNSIKAGAPEHPGLGRFGRLQDSEIEVRLLSEKSAVARVHHMSQGTESYFYLIEDNGWKLSAIRTPLEGRNFAPGFDIDEPSHDENWNRLEAERNRQLTPAQKASQDAYHAEQVRAFRHSLMTDAEIKVWFEQHQADLNVLAKQAMADLKVGEFRRKDLSFNSLSVSVRNADESVAGRLRALELSEAQKLKDKNVYLVFARGRYSLSGVLFSGDNCPPPIGPYGTIWTERLADHWYLMRVIDEQQFPVIEAHQVQKPAIKLAP